MLMTPTTLSTKKRERTRCEIFDRTVGYYAPISRYNPGKLAERNDRLRFKIK